MCKMSEDAAGGDIKISDCGRCKWMCSDADSSCVKETRRDQYPDENGNYGTYQWCTKGNHGF